MTHFAVIAPPFLSHMRAMEAIGAALVARGHRVTFVNLKDAAASLRDPALDFRPVGTATHPPGALRAIVRRAARPVGPGILRVIHDMAGLTDMLCRELPKTLRAIGAEALVVDQMEAAGGLVASHLGLPFVSVANALPVNREPLVPLPFLPWTYEATERAQWRNRGGERVSDLLMTELGRVIARHANAFGLPPARSVSDCLSPLAQISQAVRGFDLPRRELPSSFSYVGPLRPPLEREPPLQYPVRDDRPFVFASLGTLQGGRGRIFRAIARACRALDVQLLVAHCGGLDDAQARALGATWVTDFAPQRAVLARADAAITHAGLNTTLDALSFGVPLLAIPIAFDQPGVAARIVHVGAGERLSHLTLTAGQIEAALRRLLADQAYREAAGAIGREIAASGGADEAAGIVERAVCA